MSAVPTLEDLDDASLVRLCLDGDERAPARLLERHQGAVYSLLVRVLGNPRDAEDAAQDAFLKAFRALESYDPSRPLRSWLFKIAHNAALDRLRARRDESALDDPDAGLDPADEAPGPEDLAERALDGALVEKLVAALPPLYREALLLRHAEGLSVEETAAALSLPVGTVKIRLFRARELMRRKWEAFEEHETRGTPRP